MHGSYCGTSVLDGIRYEIFTKNGHFGKVSYNKFLGHVKRSVLRKAGIFCHGAKKPSYTKNGYVGPTAK